MRIIEINDVPHGGSETWIDGVRMQTNITITRDSGLTSVAMDDIPVRDCLVFKNGLLVARAR